MKDKRTYTSDKINITINHNQIFDEPDMPLPNDYLDSLFPPTMTKTKKIP